MKTSACFWDTSAIVPLCCPQPASQSLRLVIRRIPQVVAWWGTPVEARSALGRLLRDQDLTPRQYRHASDRLDILKASWREVQPIETVRRLAETLPATYGLRALDSFQLAAALVWCNEKPKGRLFVCDDIRLSEAADKAGFQVLP